MRWLSFLLFLISSTATARTIWSGSFINLSVPKASVEVGINYPAAGKGRICGIELKSHTMILHKRVWEAVAQGLTVDVSFDEGASQVLEATIVVSEGPQLSYELKEFGASYAVMTLKTASGENLDGYFTQLLNPNGSSESVIAVAKDCP